MFFGDDENVRGGLGVDVFEGEDVVIFVDFFGGDFAAEDAAEKALGIGHFGLTEFIGENDNIAAAGLSAGGSAPQRLKPRSFGGLCGTTEVVPFPVVAVSAKSKAANGSVSAPHKLPSG